MTPALQLEIDTRLEDIPRARDAASQWLAGQGAFAGAGYLAGLAIEELVTNCLKYGHDHPRGHCVAVRVEYVDGELRLRVEDDGRPFNPLDRPAPDLTLPAGERPLGGLGLHLLRRMFDRMEYRRVGGRNEVRLFKRDPAVAGPGTDAAG